MASVLHVHLMPSGQLCLHELVLVLCGVVQPYIVAPCGVCMVEEYICLHIPLAHCGILFLKAPTGARSMYKHVPVHA